MICNHCKNDTSKRIKKRSKSVCPFDTDIRCFLSFVLTNGFGVAKSVSTYRHKFSESDSFAPFFTHCSLAMVHHQIKTICELYPLLSFSSDRSVASLTFDWSYKSRCVLKCRITPESFLRWFLLKTIKRHSMPDERSFACVLSNHTYKFQPVFSWIWMFWASEKRGHRITI